MLKFLSTLLCVISTIGFFEFAIAQNNRVIEVNGANWISVFQNAYYYIDSTEVVTPKNIQNFKESFKSNKESSLNLGKQAHPVWINIQLKNIAKPQKYWLSVYSHLDSLWVYENEGGFLKLKKFSSFAKSPFSRDSMHRVRFHVAVFEMDKYETLDVYLKFFNKRHYTNVYADFTSPEGNLQWENKFYWKQGFFLGCFFLGIVLSFILAYFVKNKLIFIYGLYLLFSILIILQEEFTISLFDNSFLYSFFYRLNTLFLLPINMGFCLYIFVNITSIGKLKNKLTFWLEKFAFFLVLLGSITSVSYFFFYTHLGFQNPIFNFIWDLILVILGIAVVLVAGIVGYYFYLKKNYLNVLVFPLILLILNPVSYFLNYSKVVNFYEITYPNYYYYFLVVEIFLLGIIIAIQYRNTQHSNIKFLKEKIEIEQNLTQFIQKNEKKIQSSIIESQEHLLKNLSQDLHDDIGQRLSIINFSIENLKLTGKNTNQFDEIQNSVLEISESLRDLSHWLNDFDIQNTAFERLVKNEIKRLDKIVPINFEFKLIPHSIKNYQTTITEKIILYRIIQEATHNIIKHSQAKNARIQIDFSLNLSLSIKDDGRGIDLNNSGNGLQNIQHRARLIEYNLNINSTKNGGTELKLTKNV